MSLALKLLACSFVLIINEVKQVSYIISIIEKIRNHCEDRCEVVSDGYYSLDYPRTKVFLPKVLVFPSSVVAFVELNDSAGISEGEMAVFFRNIVNSLSVKLDISVNSIFLVGCGNENDDDNKLPMFTYNTYNSKVSYYDYYSQEDVLVLNIVSDLNYRARISRENRLSDVYEKLQLMFFSNGAVKYGADGHAYIKKHGSWVIASDLDPDETFKKCALFGAFGVHKFAEPTRSKKLTGILYFLTCGLFGVGWLADCVSMLLGVYRDSEKKYVAPVSDIKKCLLYMLLGALITVVYFYALRFSLVSLMQLVNGTIEGVATPERLQGLADEFK